MQVTMDNEKQKAELLQIKQQAELEEEKLRQEEKKKSQKKIICVVIALLIVIVGGIFCFFWYQKQQKRPEKALERALLSLMNQVETSDNPILQGFEEDSLLVTCLEGNGAVKYSVNLSGLEALKGMTLGLDGDWKINRDEEKMSLDCTASVANMELIGATLVGQKDDVYLQIPDIYEGSIYFGAKDIDGQINQSFLGTMFGVQIEEDIDLNLYEKVQIGPRKSMAEWLSEYSLEDIQIEEDVEYLLSEEEKDCLGDLIAEDYRYITVIQPEADMTCNVLLDQAENIREISLSAQNMPYEAAKMETLTVFLLGKENITEQIEILVGGRLNLEKVKDALAQIDLEDTEYISHADLLFSGSKQAQEMSAVIQEISLWDKSGAGKSPVAKVTGSIDLSPLQEDILIPEGKEYHFFEMNAIEAGLTLYGFRENIVKKFGTYLDILGIQI